ncbi:MAG TPA: right-handed parallel beta-helix repeat-containing protein, partial [Tepidisphaeraceae bacterium]|nr:right-handed parallel beta-helix repeat-containing protein [Tepidisphaeraceae bacterium]
ILLQAGATFSGKMAFGSDDKGTSAAPIKIAVYGGKRAFINAGAATGIYAQNTAGISIANLTLYTTSTSQVDGISFYNNLTNNSKLSTIRIDNCEVYGFQHGIAIGGGAGTSGFNDVRITNSALHDNHNSGLFTYSPARNVHTNVYVGHVLAYNNMGNPYDSSVGVTGHGITLGSVSGATVERCVAHDNGKLGDGGAGIWTYDSTKVLIQYCESYRNKTNYMHDGDGFDLDRNVSSSTIQYCYSHDNDGGGFMLCNRDNNTLHTGNVIRYNVSQNDARKNGYGGIHMWGRVRNAEVFNNTVYMNQAPSGTHAAVRIHNLSIESQCVEYVYLRNNIFVTSGAPALVSVTAPQLAGAIELRFQGNTYFSQTKSARFLWGNSTYTTIKQFRAFAGQEVIKSNGVGFSGDPLLASAGGGGTIGNADNLASLTAYRLQSNSPCINTGLNLQRIWLISTGSHDFWDTALPQGGAYDVGACEV